MVNIRELLKYQKEQYDDEVKKRREQFMKQREKSAQKRQEIRQIMETKNQQIKQQNLAQRLQNIIRIQFYSCQLSTNEVLIICQFVAYRVNNQVKKRGRKVVCRVKGQRIERSQGTQSLHEIRTRKMLIFCYIDQVQGCYQQELDQKLKKKEENERKIREMEEIEQCLIEKMNTTLQREMEFRSSTQSFVLQPSQNSSQRFKKKQFRNADLIDQDVVNSDCNSLVFEGKNRQSPQVMRNQKVGSCFTASKVSPRGIGAQYLLGGNFPSETKWSPVRNESNQSGSYVLQKPALRTSMSRQSQVGKQQQHSKTRSLYTPIEHLVIMNPDALIKVSNPYNDSPIVHRVKNELSRAKSPQTKGILRTSKSTDKLKAVKQIQQQDQCYEDGQKEACAKQKKNSYQALAARRNSMQSLTKSTSKPKPDPNYSLSYQISSHNQIN